LEGCKPRGRERKFQDLLAVSGFSAATETGAVEVDPNLAVVDVDVREGKFFGLESPVQDEPQDEGVLGVGPGVFDITLDVADLLWAADADVLGDFWCGDAGDGIGEREFFELCPAVEATEELHSDAMSITVAKTGEISKDHRLWHGEEVKAGLVLSQPRMKVDNVGETRVNGKSSICLTLTDWTCQLS
jgi:hypothetical protein